MKNIKALFVVSAAYDFFLGLVFLMNFRAVYNYFGITLPNHPGYVQFPAALIMIFGIGFLFVAKDPLGNRNIIKLGVLLKIAYSGIVLSYAAIGRVPFIWIPFAWMDIVFLLMFLWALYSMKSIENNERIKK